MRGTKTGGRQAGTPNKVTSELRDALKAVLAVELDTLSDSLAELPAKERLDVIAVSYTHLTLPTSDLV